MKYAGAGAVQAVAPASSQSHLVFVTGGTGYVGRTLIAQLAGRGHRVRALARPASAGALPPEVTTGIGDALNAASYAAAIAPADTLVHLVGTPHPNPSKAREFREVDLASIREAAGAARGSGVRHIVYLSVAQPAPVMRAYVDARRKGEACVRSTGIAAPILQPWYIFGPGHRWPALLKPLYALFELVPATRATARRLGLVTLEQMVCTLVRAVEHPPTSVRVVDVANIRACGA